MSSWDEDYAEYRKRMSVVDKVFIWFYIFKLRTWIMVWKIATKVQMYAQKKVDDE